MAERLPERGDVGKFEQMLQPNPRDVLTRELQGQTRGSIRVQALGDWATLESAKAKLELLKTAKSSSIGELIEVSTKKAVTEETIRGRKLGVDAAEYGEAFYGGEAHSAYLAQRWQEVGHVTDLVKGEALDRLLKDLEEVNAQLPKKVETPPNP